MLQENQGKLLRDFQWVETLQQRSGTTKKLLWLEREPYWQQFWSNEGLKLKIIGTTCRQQLKNGFSFYVLFQRTKCIVTLWVQSNAKTPGASPT
jgi:hypothetical protein